MEEQIKEENVNKKGNSIIIIILCLLVLGLGGFIVYDKFISSDSDTENVEKKDDSKKDKEEEEKIDLSNVPEVDSKCTFEYSIEDYNNENPRNLVESCAGQAKYIINDVVVDGKKINVQAIEGCDDSRLISENIKMADESQTGLFINGVKYASLYSEFAWKNNKIKEIFVRNNLLFVHLDGGDDVFGYTDILVFDKNGKKTYKLTDHVQIGTNNSISRSTIRVLDDNSITFDLGTHGNVTKYIVKYSNGKFEEPVVVNE